MNKILKTILFHELLAALMAAGLTGIIVLIYAPPNRMTRLFIFWFLVLQIVAVPRVIRASRRCPPPTEPLP